MMPSSTRTTERFRQDKGAGSTLNLVPGTLDSRAPSVRETTDTSPTDSRYRLLLAMLSERVWRMSFEEPIPIGGAPETIVQDILREARLVECTPAHAQVIDAATTRRFMDMHLAELLVAPRVEQRAILQTFVESRFRITDAESYEWDEQNRPIRVLTNMVGIIEDGHLTGLWGAQRSGTTGRQLLPVPRRLSESPSHCLCITDTEGNIQFESPDLERLLGPPLAARKGALFCDWIHPEDCASLKDCCHANMVTGGCAGAFAKVRIRRHDGAWVERAATACPMIGVPGPMLVAVSILELPGVTDPPSPSRPAPRRKRVSSRALSERICAVNNVLAVISGHAQLATMNRPVDAETNEHLQVIVDAAEQASRIVGQIGR